MAKVSARGPYLFPELVLCKGPSAEGVTGSATYAELFGYSWALSMDDSGELHLSQQQGAAWVEIPPLTPLPVLPATARHIALAFDQAARPVIAWEDSGIYLRRYDPGSSSYQNLGPFAGRDPVLFMDATVDGYIPDSDVLLYYLSADARAINQRVQRQVWATESQKYAGPDALFLDQATLLGFSFQVIAAKQSNGEVVALRAAPYPVRWTDGLTTQSFAAPNAATYSLVVIPENLGPDALTLIGFTLPTTGSYDATGASLITERLGPDGLTAQSFTPPGSGTYLEIVVVKTLPTDSLTTQSFTVPANGAYTLTVIAQTEPTDNLTTTGFTPPAGATYA